MMFDDFTISHYFINIMRQTIKISTIVLAVLALATPLFAYEQSSPYSSSYGYYDPYYSYDENVYNRGGNFYRGYNRENNYDMRYHDAYYRNYYKDYYDNYYKNYYNNYYKDYYNNYYNNYYSNYYKNQNTVTNQTPIIRWPESDPTVSKWPENEPFDELFSYPPKTPTSVTKPTTPTATIPATIFTLPTISLNNTSTGLKIEDGVGVLSFKGSKDNAPEEDSFIFTIGPADNNTAVKTTAITNSLTQVNDTDWKVSFAIPTSLKDSISDSNYSLSYSYTDANSGKKISGSNAKLSFNN